MAELGYYRHPTISGQSVVFVVEDDLWTVSTDGGLAHRLTANPGTHAGPRFSPDGRNIAFTSRDEGRMEVHLMEADGGPSRRLTYFAANTRVAGWRKGEVLVASDHRSPFNGWFHLWAVPTDGSPARSLEVGPGSAIAIGDQGTVLARYGFDPSRWKRYRGGLAGRLWIDRGEGFKSLITLDGNLASPMWVKRRLFFLSDHEGVGNLYSVTPTGRSLRRHTDHSDFFARFPSSDGQRIVYHVGGDLWILDPGTGENRPLDVRIPSARAQRNRRFVPVARHLGSLDLHPEGHSVMLTSRGSSFTMPLWEGAARRHDPGSSVRERLACYSSDGRKMFVISDASGDERLLVRDMTNGEETQLDKDLGRVRSMAVSPGTAARIAITNNRHELLLVEPGRRSVRLLHRSPFSWIVGCDWSPDGKWLAFGAATTRTTSNLFLYELSSKKIHRIGRAEFGDRAPAFDPEGKYLYFLGGRFYEPIPDSIFHDYGFPRATKPMALVLASGTPSPFDVAQRTPRGPGAGGPDPKPASGTEEVVIDVDGLSGRVVAFPVAPGAYTSIAAGRGKVFFTSRPLQPQAPADGPPKQTLQSWDFASDKLDLVSEGLTGVALSADRKAMALLYGRKLRVVPSGWKDDKNGKDAASRETGWIDFDRVRLEVDPGSEWRQMFDEAWRLQRDFFWTEDMGGVDWSAIHSRYRGLVDRVSSRAEFSDLLWEMQGELGTSHAYELGGEYRPEPTWTQGMLGADLVWSRGTWRVQKVPEGDSWSEESPLARPGVGVIAGDRILEIDGTPVDRLHSPESQLVHRAGKSVEITVSRGRTKPRQVVVTPLASETVLRYRDWVNTNRARVKESSDGRNGYIHIPDMQAAGFAEFHRGFRAEVDCDGLVIDVRFNRGGNVSQILLERLLRKRLGYRVTRWRGMTVFPYDAPAGPMVCLTNELTGSDGDIFSHTFKQHGLGPLIGTRTWGGVVGIWPQQSLVDGTVTTQPEFGTWFNDVGYAVENYGTDPDILVEITPDDYRRGVDTQLERGMVELEAILASLPSRPQP